MTPPPTIAQLRNLADRASRGPLTADETARLREGIAMLAEYENTINWHTTCTSCARVLDSSISETERAEKAEAALARVRELHQPMQRGPFTICAHCSGWDGKWRCLGVVTNYPCPTITALDDEPQETTP